jgi:hypothetical protein
MRIMFDTNVLISAGLFPNEQINHLIEFIVTEHELVLSDVITDESFIYSSSVFIVYHLHWRKNLHMPETSWRLSFLCPNVSRAVFFRACHNLKSRIVEQRPLSSPYSIRKCVLFFRFVTNNPLKELIG